MCIVAQKFNYGTSTKLKFDNQIRIPNQNISEYTFNEETINERDKNIMACLAAFFGLMLLYYIQQSLLKRKGGCKTRNGY